MRQNIRSLITSAVTLVGLTLPMGSVPFPVLGAQDASPAVLNDLIRFATVPVPALFTQQRTKLVGFSTAGRPIGFGQDEIESGATVDLRIGQSVTVAGEALTTLFEGVAGDSRCPRGVTCVWEGDAVVRVTASKGSERVALELHTSRRFPQEASIGDYGIRLVQLSPEPTQNEKIDDQDYVARITVVRKRQLPGPQSLDFGFFLPSFLTSINCARAGFI